MIRAGVRRALRLALRRRDQWERDVEDEIKLHLALRAEQLAAAGRSPDAAYEEAVRRFGPLDQSRAMLLEAARHRETKLQRSETMSDFVHDLAFAWRTMRREKTWAAVTVATFALGIGASTAVFSVVSSLLLHPVSYPDASHVVLVDRTTTQPFGGLTVSISVPGVLARAWRSSARDFSDLEPYAQSTVELSARDGTSEISAAHVLPTFARFAGVQPIIGRGLAAGDARAHAVVIGEGFWRSHFGGSARAIGATLTLDDTLYTVAGVMPARLVLPGNQGRDVDVWLPIDLAAASPASDAMYQLVGRLRDGVSPEDARRELDAVTARSGLTAQEIGAERARVQRPDAVVSFRDSLLLLAVAVMLVLLIACANVAHLLLARGAARRREMAIRLALGAGRARLMRQLLTESLTLSVAGATLGMGLGWVGLRSIIAAAPSALAELSAARVDMTTLGVAIAVTVASSIVFGVIGALQVAPNATHETLKSGAVASSRPRRHERVRALLVVSEMALSATLLVGASLVVRSIWNMQHTDLGFAPHGLYVVRSMFPHAEQKDSVGRAARAVAIEARLRAMPSVRAVAATNTPPGWFSFRIGALQTEGEPSPPAGTTAFINADVVERSYFSTMGMRFLEGGTFSDTGAHSTEVIVNAGYARKHWPAGHAVGHLVRVVYNGQGAWQTIVGVVNDVSAAGPMGDPGAPVLYSPATRAGTSLMVRTGGTATPLPEIRSLVRSVDPRARVEIQSVDQIVRSSIAEPRFVMALLTTFTALALLLAAIGLYGVMAYSVAQRTREIGIRIALGAPAGRIARSVIGRGIALALAGSLFGVAGALWGSKLVSLSLYGVSRTDPASVIVGVLVLGCAAVAACVVPTRRALAVDPMTAIRAD